jgi:hypothetical protein
VVSIIRLPVVPAMDCRRPFLLVALDQAMDTVSDVWRHAARQLVSPPDNVNRLKQGIVQLLQAVCSQLPCQNTRRLDGA